MCRNPRLSLSCLFLLFFLIFSYDYFFFLVVGPVQQQHVIRLFFFFLLSGRKTLYCRLVPPPFRRRSWCSETVGQGRMENVERSIDDGGSTPTPRQSARFLLLLTANHPHWIQHVSVPGCSSQPLDALLP